MTFHPCKGVCADHVGITEGLVLRPSTSGMGPDPEPDPDPESGPDFLASDLNIRTGFRTGHFPVPDRTGFHNNFQFMITFTVIFLGH